jgi:8-oxo-dGTP diphosphatase
LTAFRQGVSLKAILGTRRNPAPTVDVIIEVPGGIVLIKRRYPPPGWALPGGFVEYGETLAAAAVREAREETGLDVALTELFNVYSDPRRDPRRHTIAVVFIGHATGTPVGADDAAQAEVFTAHSLPQPLAFDHAQILDDYFAYKRSGRRPAYDR